mmetsp:Transcript_57107/g.66735  ORF Transcript_57107/g.66735 Transcript_57107/m.66735 type:complete len:179 (+) Transcript_57107:84-620(+)|eukprot:CAMPEP_0171302794 /NCGR_PEP_ID=MMETSP0816-20121228/12253_1 /TAXON_ID=420281 /ORGANISM="Proboscia inermis, Strain CCAP1064/1" /LENGTH=178 /DNA_ID=CAMNT_0011781541 /DNA_START=66 /DNA_END=602 /DNA_ORIENTATION=+
MFTRSIISSRTAINTIRRFGNTNSLSAANSSQPVSISSPGSTPSVHDMIVNLAFVDEEGSRQVLPAYVGKTLYENAVLHGIDLGPSSVGGPVEAVRSDTWTEPLYGEGATSGYDHVLVSGKGVDTIKPMDYSEKKMLEAYWEENEIFPESRLASQVTISKEMNGMIVYIPDRLVDNVP